jgi:hypothetical protein
MHKEIKPLRWLKKLEEEGLFETEPELKDWINHLFDKYVNEIDNFDNSCVGC